MATYVIDSWPVLEWLKNKPLTGARFEQFLENAIQTRAKLVMSRMNYGEIIYSLAKPVPHPLIQTLLGNMRALPIEILTVDDLLVDEAADLKARHTCSYADCFAAALAIRTNAPLVTGDPEFLKLQQAGLLTVEWLGA